MGRPTIKSILNLDEPLTKREFVRQAGVLSGFYEVSLKPRRSTRSLAQNAWLWSCINSALAQYLSDQDYEVTTAEQAHEILKDRFLRVDVVNPMTGEVIAQRVRSTTELTTVEMADYCERCRVWMADFFGIIVPDPGEYGIDPTAHSAKAVSAV